MRTKRTDGTNTYTYVYNGNQLVQMSNGIYTLYFTYNASGHPATVKVNSTLYYYITNLQGDVTGIWNETEGYICEYAYDAWGNIVSTTTHKGRVIVNLNPLRYRGYVYDPETQLYYLQSRYYNPEWGRFLNADAFVSTGQGLLGNNMFAYCGNNPVVRKDDGGESWLSALVGGAIAGAIIGAVSHIVSCGISGSKVTASGVLGAAVTGAVTGAIGAIGGVVEGAKKAASIGAGIISGVTTAINTDGSADEKIVAGLTAFAVSAGGTYLGTKIPVAEDTAFTTGVTSFAGGLFAGANTEIANVGAQQFVSSFFNDTSSGSRAIGGGTFSSGHLPRSINKAILL